MNSAAVMLLTEFVSETVVVVMMLTEFVSEEIVVDSVVCCNLQVLLAKVLSSRLFRRILLT